MYKLVDFATKKTVSTEHFIFTGENGPWEVLMDMEKVKAQLDMNVFKAETPALAKYLPFMPIRETSDFVSLGEAATPLVKSQSLGKRLGVDLYFKVEGKNPTGSFKDRGSAVDISLAKELGAKGIILASTGNMAASCACYAALAKIPCFILVPEGVPISKLSQVLAFGGNIVQVKGHYNDAARLAEVLAKKMGFYLAGDYAYRVEGQKTAAFELIDQLSFESPDYVFVPVGCGTNLTAYGKGFKEYQKLGLIDRVPQLVGVQAEGACSLANSFNENSRTITPLKSVDTLATAIAVADPLDGVKALDAIYSTNGFAVSVSDSDILKAHQLLAREEGLFVESSSATTLAALIKAVELGKCINAKVVCVLTGDGLKDAHIVLKTSAESATIEPNEEAFLNLYQNNAFNNAGIFSHETA